MIVKGKSNSFQEIDTGTMIVSIGHKCDICDRKADTVRISDVRVCPSCIYVMTRDEIKKRRREKVHNIVKVVDAVAKRVDSTTIRSIVRILGRSRIGVGILSGMLFGRRKR